MNVQYIIKARRAQLGLTLKEVAKALGVSEGTVSRYETGDIQNMGIDKIHALSKVLQCSPSYLMGWEELNDNFPLSNVEETIIAKYRKSDDVTKEMVHRILNIETNSNFNFTKYAANSCDIIEEKPETSNEFEKLYPPVGELKPDKDA